MQPFPNYQTISLERFRQIHLTRGTIQCTVYGGLQNALKSIK